MNRTKQTLIAGERETRQLFNKRAIYLIKSTNRDNCRRDFLSKQPVMRLFTIKNNCSQHLNRKYAFQMKYHRALNSRPWFIYGAIMRERYK